MLGIRVDGTIVALTASFPKALAYVAHLLACCPFVRTATIDANVSGSYLAHWEHQQMLMDDYANNGGTGR
jgi:hypothetical protein